MFPEVNSKVLPEKKTMAEGRKHKKMVARAKVGGDTLPPVAAEKAPESVG